LAAWAAWTLWRSSGNATDRRERENDDDEVRSEKKGSEETTSVARRFRRAASFARTLNIDDTTIQLKMYGLYKQAVTGPCKDERPWAADFRGCAKWDAWSSHGDKSKEEASKEYLNLIETLSPGWEESAHSRDQSAGSPTKEKTKSRGGGGMGVSVSTMASVLTEEGDGAAKDVEDDVFVDCSRGDVSSVKEKLASGAVDVNGRDTGGMTLLHWACDRNHRDLVEHLLERGANIDAQDNDGMTPFALAVMCEHDDLALLLASSGANIELPDNDGEVPSENYSQNLRSRLDEMRSKKTD